MTERLIGPRRGGGRVARQEIRRTAKAVAVHPGLEGGIYRPLSEADIARIHEAVLEVLSSIGMADATPELIALAVEQGATLNAESRLWFPAGVDRRCAGRRAAPV